MKASQLLLSTACALFHGVTGTPSPPALTYLGSANASLATPIAVGVGPLGPRTIIGITGGTFKGPRFSASISNIGGGDWGLGDPAAHAFYVDARYVMRTTDGANIYVVASGPQQDSGVIHSRVKFETGHPKYSWLNKVVAIGFEYPGPGYIIIDVWKVESPVAGKGEEGKQEL
ncbi:hypothetical protein QBC39DRAFT_338115, partial [Podospora conica]